jgi:hypothetical protein
MIRIINDLEYVLDTSVLMAGILNYAGAMKEGNPESTENYDSIHEVCFAVLLELVKSKIALDRNNIIKNEYEEEVLDRFPTDFPAQWYSIMERQGKIKFKDIIIDGRHRAEMRRRFGLSMVDCTLIHVAQHSSSRIVLHRDGGISNASGYANQHFRVRPVNVMRD